MRLGDLDKLKTEFENLASDDYNEPIWYQKTVFETIDNAPTVEAYSFEQVQELVKLNQQFAQEIENLKRPQGEWEEYACSDERGCSLCGYMTRFYFEYHFCPNCGAEMRGEKE